MKYTVLSIASDDKLYTPEGVGATSSDVAKSLAELVANSIDWALLNDNEVGNLKDNPDFMEKLETKYGSISMLRKDLPNAEVEVYYDCTSSGNATEFRVIDSGVGMTQEELQNG